MFHHQRSRHHHPVPIRDPSSFVLWFLVGIALISLVFTTRQAAASYQAQPTVAAASSHAVTPEL
jgi:hypothetical protein